MAGLFANILLDEGVVRDRAINFLSVKMKLLLAEDLLTKDIEELFIQHCKKVCNQSAKFHNSFFHSFRIFWRTCPRSLHGSWSGIRTCDPPDARYQICHWATTPLFCIKTIAIFSGIQVMRVSVMLWHKRDNFLTSVHWTHCTYQWIN